MQSVSKFFDGGDIIANYKLDLEVRDGEFLVFLGPSGCGKTTALRMIAGLETPSEGDIYFDDDRVTDMAPADRNVAMVFQNYALYPHMSVRENIEYPLKIRGVPPEERDERVAEIADLLHIEDQLDSDPANISGGQRQRTSLARAIIREPSVFLLDEPLSNLDAKLRLEMRSELKRLQNELDITTVYVTHNQEEAMSMGDRIAVMNEGTIRQVADPEELYRRPRTAWVAEFIGSPPMNLLEGSRRNGAIHVDDENAVPATDDAPPDDVSVGFRPEDLAVTATEPDTDWCLRGRVKTVEPLGEYVLVNVDVGDATVNAKVDHSDLESGQQVFVSVDRGDVYLYDGDGELVA
ncbi:ABC transporter ATP-binding protein [Halobacterium yunchengense]|uniref:ABC transporter ATP-binding protein n=1 Tax=Halobacterium yunchengense TaxID=3108497 RepID=UPI003AB12783